MGKTMIEAPLIVTYWVIQTINIDKYANVY